MGNGGNEIKQPNALFRCILSRKCQQHTWWPDAYAWWLQLHSSGWYHPSSSRGYDPWYWGVIRWWCWNDAPKSKKLADNGNRLPIFPFDSSKEHYPTAAIPRTHQKQCGSSSLCQLGENQCCRWGCGLAIRLPSHCKSFCCLLPSQ